MPCYQWNRSVIVRHDHPLANNQTLTLKTLSEFPIVTYVFGFTGRSQLDQAFRAEGLTPKVVFTASDADVIKTYVKLGLGVGIIASMAYEKTLDKELIALDASYLFEPSTTKIGFRKGIFLRGYMFDFIELFAPHLTREVVETAMRMQTMAELDQLFGAMELPLYY